MHARRSGQAEGTTGEDSGWPAGNGATNDKALSRLTRELEPDTLDRQIISLLQADGRCSNREIARQLDVPEATVRYRVRRLTESGLLRITALVSPEHLGYQLSVVINVQVEAPQVNNVAETLGALPDVIWLMVTSGEHDIVLAASFQGHEHLYHFLTEELANVPGIVRTSTSVGLRVVKRDFQWAFDLTSEVSSE